MGFMDRMKDAAKQAQTGAGKLGEAAKEGVSPSEITVKVDPADPNNMLLWG